ncbi:hypothetical protein [Pseudomonas promysalinigenes]|uniref:hypothetical protein n=1 Tax=Pseudomonas promysalinigenes TaxID=485898 RepID=UPI003FA0BFF3
MTTQTTAPSPVCIYCEGPGPFTDEHVISAGLGADDDRYLLVDMVCKRCNTDVLGKLELEVLRCSPIAIGRAFMQPHGRDRGKRTAAPGIQARRKQMASTSGYPHEVDFGRHAQPIVLPQLKITGEKTYDSAAAGPDELRSFLMSLSTLLQGTQVTCIRKRGPEHELRYETITMLRSDKTFTQAAESSFEATPPRAGLWLERYDATDAAGQTPAATIFQNLNKGIVLKTSSATVEDALNFLAHAVEQFSFDTQETVDTEGPIISVEMTVTVGAMERVIAKIGINLLAYYLGRDYVTDPGLQQVKDSILTGTPRLSADIIEDASIQSILDAAPENHHVFCLSKASQPGERASITVIAKLYGAAQSLVLATDVPEPHLPLPVFFLVDYLNHKVKQWSLHDYSEHLVKTVMNEAQARYGSTE